MCIWNSQKVLPFWNGQFEKADKPDFESVLKKIQLRGLNLRIQYE